MCSPIRPNGMLTNPSFAVPGPLGLELYTLNLDQLKKQIPYTRGSAEETGDRAGKNPGIAGRNVASSTSPRCEDGS